MDDDNNDNRSSVGFILSEGEHGKAMQLTAAVWYRCSPPKSGGGIEKIFSILCGFTVANFIFHFVYQK